MAYLIADMGYLLVVLCDFGALLLILEYLVHLLPGAGLNSARRTLFHLSSHLLKWNEHLLGSKWGSFNSRGLLTAFFLLIISRYVASLIVLYSYSLRG